VLRVYHLQIPRPKYDLPRGKKIFFGCSSISNNYLSEPHRVRKIPAGEI